MEGLEISVKRFSEVVFDNPTLRYDSEYFKKEYLKLFSTLLSNECDKMEPLSSWITQGPNPVFNEDADIPCLTGRNINKGTVNYNNPDYVDAFEYESLKRFQLKHGDTLITLKGKGSIGKIGYVTDERKAIFSRDIGVIRPSKINAGYVNAFILSHYGKKLIERGETGGTGQSTLTTAYLKNIDIPRFSIEDNIGEIIELSETKLKKSEQLYQDAMFKLLDITGFRYLKIPDKTINIKSFNATINDSGRLDSEYYLPKYEEYLTCIKSYKNGTLRLGDVGCFKNGSFISDENYSSKGQRAFIRIKELSLEKPIDSSQVVFIDDAFKSRNETVVNTNDFIIATIGNTIGKVNLITSFFDGSFPSNNTSKYSLFSDKSNFNYFELMLRSMIVQEQIQREFTQTAQPKISNESLANIIIPNIEEEFQLEISSLIDESKLLLKQSEYLIETGKIAVEKAIEEKEEIATQYINEKLTELKITIDHA